MVSELTQEYLEIVEEAIDITKGYEPGTSDNYKDHVIGLKENLTEFIEKLWKKIPFEAQVSVVQEDYSPVGTPSYSFDELAVRLCSYIPIVYGFLEKHFETPESFLCYKLFSTLFDLEEVIKQWKMN